MKHKQYLNIFDKFLFKQKYFLRYIFYGLISVSIELLIRNFLINANITETLSNYLSLLIGITLMFYLNANYNFKIPRYLYIRSFIYFLIIDLLSISIEYYLNLNHFVILNEFQNSFINNIDIYNTQRILLFSIFFIIGYFLHLKIAFIGSCKVGIAIYAKKTEDIKTIFERVGFYPDFIHVDLVDNGVSLLETDHSLNVFYEIKKFWPSHKIETHIMSKKPFKWIEKVIKFSDIIYYDNDIDEDLYNIKEYILKKKCEPGIILKVTKSFENQKKLIKDFKNILLLTIRNPGKSGQSFESNAFEFIDKINKSIYRNKFKLCIDGGINADLVKKIKSDKIISASDILHNQYPKKRILRLNTFSKYEK